MRRQKGKEKKLNKKQSEKEKAFKSLMNLNASVSSVDGAVGCRRE